MGCGHGRNQGLDDSRVLILKVEVRSWGNKEASVGSGPSVKDNDFSQSVHEVHAE